MSWIEKTGIPCAGYDPGPGAGCVRRRQEQAENARLALAAQVEDWDRYEVVFVGYPDWWGDAAMVIYSFLEARDWQGKTLIPFCTSGGSGFGRSLDRLADSTPGAETLERLHVSGDCVPDAADEVPSWIAGLPLAWVHKEREAA